MPRIWDEFADIAEPDPPVDAIAVAEIEQLLNVAQQYQQHLARLLAAGGLAAQRGRVRPLVLAQLDRSLETIGQLTQALLDHKNWIGREGRQRNRAPLANGKLSQSRRGKVEKNG